MHKVAAVNSPAVEPRDPLVGTRIDGRYIVVGVLGRGGMGVVYDGMHEQLGRSVAIKVLGPGVAGDANAVQRFLREARIASQLTHGNIVEVSDLGTLPDGRPFLVMAKLQGIDLSHVLEKYGPQSPGRTVELLRGAAAALDLVHAKGFVHRDVKPENLMHVVREDGSEAVLLLDFGIVGLASPDSARLTAEGVVFGTPCYLAPEVVRGEAPGPASDTYALATVAYELITGRAPYTSANVMQLMQLKMTEDPPKMSLAAGFRIDPEVEEVVATSLARDPSQRHRSPGAFIAALARAIQTGATDPSPVVTGLDAQMRQRLSMGSGELELSSLERSGPPPSNDGTTQSQAPVSVPVVPRSFPRLPLIAAGAGALLLGGATLWFLTADGPPPPKLYVPDPKPVVAEPAPASEPATTTTAPEPAVTPTPTAAAAPPAVRPARVEHAAARDVKPRREPAAAPAVPAAQLISKAQDELVQGHMSAALTLYEQATQAEPQNAAAYRGLGLVNERLGRKAAAVKAMRRAITLAPSDPKNALLREHIERLEAAGP
jgi:eukaryotic-like serine/threonine-protein kinase